MPHRLDITRRLQQRLLEIVGTTLPLIPSLMKDSDLVGLAHMREEMIAAMEAYCRHVHRLRDQAVVGGDGLERDACDLLVDGCSSLNEAYAAFRDRWAHRDAIGNWYEYRLSAVVMMKQVRAHVQSAEKALEGRRLAA